MNWSLSQLLESLHQDLQQRLELSRKSFAHPVAKGDASEKTWLELLQTYLPERYQAETAHVVDSLGSFSEQIDIVVFDRNIRPSFLTFKVKRLFLPKACMRRLKPSSQLMQIRSSMRRRRSPVFAAFIAPACRSHTPAAHSLQNP